MTDYDSNGAPEYCYPDGTGAPLDYFGQRNDFTLMPAERDHPCYALTVGPRGTIETMDWETRGTGSQAMLSLIGSLMRNGTIPNGWDF